MVSTKYHPFSTFSHHFGRLIGPRLCYDAEIS